MRNKLRLFLLPGGLFLLMVICFGVMIPWLGFYWDDWPVLLTYKLKGLAGFWDFYRFDRPFSAWTYVVMMPVLGFNAPAWHIATLVLRWLTALALAWAFSGVWPDNRREVALTAVLFAVYPVFTQQSISVAYSQHWICFLLYFLSLGAMTWSRRGKNSVALTIAGAGAAVLALLTMEYTAGLELIRPLILWLMKSAGPDQRGRNGLWARARWVLMGWLPYLAGLAGFSIWRLFFARLADPTSNTPSLLFGFPHAPLQTSLRLLEAALGDTSHILVGVWASLVNKDVLQLQDRFTLLSWVVTAVVTIAVFVVFRSSTSTPTKAQTSDTGQPLGPHTEENWGGQVLIFGLVTLVLGMLPIWLTDRQITQGAFSDRFGLPAMLGASLVFVGGFSWLAPAWLKRVALVSVLVGLSAGMHLRNANDYRWSWVKQTRFYWQLSWRAPAIQPHTGIFSDGEIFPYVGLYSTVSGINLLYPPANLAGYELPYYFYSLGREFIQEMPLFKQGIPVNAHSFRLYTFNSSTRDGLVIFYDPTINNCLHVLSPGDELAPDLPGVTIQAVGNSNLSRILPNSAAASGNYPSEKIFGPEPNHGWCYLYEKAELARQQGDWQGVAALGNQAEQQGYTIRVPDSSTAYEWLPFIEGFARLGQWEQARQLSFAITKQKPPILPRLCELIAGLPTGKEADQLSNDLQCYNYR